jgi:hypothetical protein
MADTVCELRSEELAVTLLPDAGARLHSVEVAYPAQLAAVAVESQTHAPAGLRRLLNGAPHAPRWLAPGAILRFTITLAFRRWAPGTDR